MKSSILALLILTSSAAASTYIVDSAGGPGADFTDIASAIAAAEPLDVLLVRDGTYASFILDKGLVILGGPGVLVQGSMSVIGIPGGHRAALVGLTSGVIDVDSCGGAVLLQDLTSFGALQVSSSADVRASNVFVEAPQVALVPACFLDHSRLEMIDSILVGAQPQGQNGESGGPALVLADQSSGHVLTTSLRPGSGTNVNIANASAGTGAHGIICSQSQLRIVGSSIEGSHGGLNPLDCTRNGPSGFGIAGFQGATHFSSMVTVVHPSNVGLQCALQEGIAYAGASFTAVTPNDPLLRVEGTPAAGQLIRFQVFGPPGSIVELALGRSCIIQDSLGDDVETLTTSERKFVLGVMPMSSVLEMPFVVPGHLPQGFIIVTQAELLLPGGVRRHTNSAPIVVR